MFTSSTRLKRAGCPSSRSGGSPAFLISSQQFFDERYKSTFHIFLKFIVKLKNLSGNTNIVKDTDIADLGADFAPLPMQTKRQLNYKLRDRKSVV